jgi:hypothetical protein
MGRSAAYAGRLGFFAAICLALVGMPAIDRPATDNSSAAPPPHRPAALMPLYVTLATLQALDVDSTMRALRNGGREANPVVGGIVESPGTLAAIKAATTGGVVLMMERLRKRHPKAAVFLMIGVDSAFATVTAHNYGLAAADRRH